MARTTSIGNWPTGPAHAGELGERPWDPAPDVLFDVLLIGPRSSGGSQLSFEFGLSAWWHRTGANFRLARAYLFEVRVALLAAGGLDVETEPFPMVGRSDRGDLLAIATYLSDLLRRAATKARCNPEDLFDRALGLLELGANDRTGVTASHSR